MAKDAIVIYGAPGIGKSTVASGLKSRLGWPVIELGFIRMTYLDPQWKMANPKEAQMSFEIMCHMVHRFVRHGLSHIMLVDLLPEHVEQLDAGLAGLNYLMISLVVRSREAHRARILDPTRDSGYRDVERAWAWNSKILSRPRRPEEALLDTTDDTVLETIERVSETVGSWHPDRPLRLAAPQGAPGVP